MAYRTGVSLLLWRWLPLRRRWGVIQIIAALSVVGIAIGAGTLLSVLSIFKGFHHAAQTLLLRYDPHIRLVPVQGQWMVAPPETLKAYARLSGAQAVMPVVSLRPFCPSWRVYSLLLAKCFGDALSCCPPSRYNRGCQDQGKSHNSYGQDIPQLKPYRQT